MAIHCKTPMEKFHILVYALQKLFSGVDGSCQPENPDHVMMQEILLGGHLYLTLLKDKLLNWLQTVQAISTRWAVQNPTLPFRHSKN